jgi:3'-5' exoribonuclease
VDRRSCNACRQIEQVGNTHLRQLLYRVFSNPEVEGRFRQAPAARGMHHAYRSGLLEHTVSTAAAARLLAAHYQVDADLAAAGALLHDLGKVWEFELDAAIRYTDDGQLLGHLTLGAMFVERALGELKSFPAELRRHLLHIPARAPRQYEVLPRRPKHAGGAHRLLADNIDSKLAGMMDAIAGQREETGGLLLTPTAASHRRRPPSGD